MPKLPAAPTQLRCNLFLKPEQAILHSTQPRFSWAISAPHSQSAYQIQVASSAERLLKSEPELWNSGKIQSDNSLAIPYEGTPLTTGQPYFWQVRFWDAKNQPAEFSAIQQFHITPASSSPDAIGEGYLLQESRIPPTQIVSITAGHYFIDFAKAAFGTIELTVPETQAGKTLTIHLGEKLLASNTIDRQPPGTIRYRQLKLKTQPGQTTYRLEIPADERNTGRRTIKMPPETSEVLPFRYCEIAGWDGPLTAENIRQIITHYPFDANASDFTCSDDTLNAIWELSKYTIKATSFCGVYVDGDRERFPREADAYINQLSHYAVDGEYTLARRTHEFMLTHTSQWTEWILQSIFMAWADYAYTGDCQTLAKWYPLLQAKSLTALAGADGLISTKTGLVNDALRKAIYYFEGEHVWGPDLKDIVDWPAGERDDFDFQNYNTVVNAFYYQGLRLMAKIAEALNKPTDAEKYAKTAERVYFAFNAAFLNQDTGFYVDGKGTTHSSIHANIFPLAFGLTPPQNLAPVLALIKSKGMACSPYGAQYMLEALYQNGESDYALELMTQKSKRSWTNMLQTGSTMTLEAWDEEFKPNLDWNHPWGTAPVNIVSRFVLGITPSEAGFRKINFTPNPGPLTTYHGTVPTICGRVHMEYQKKDESGMLFTLTLPGNTTGQARLPLPEKKLAELRHNGNAAWFHVTDNRICIDGLLPGQHTFELLTDQ